MLETSQLISDVKGEFEGGVSLSVDWDTLIRRAVENVIDNCRPETLKRRVPIYGGLARDLFIYYCPADVLVPSDLYTNDGRRKFKYQPPKTFYTREEYDKYTIEYVNGVRFLVVRHNTNQGAITIDAMDAVGTKTGGSPALNEHNFLSGGAAVEATFTDAGVEFGDNITAIDITDYLRGVAIMPVYISDATKLSSLELRLKTSDAAYYKILSTSDSIGDYFVNGWNLVRFQLSSRAQVGSPNSASIVEWSVIGRATTGESITLIFDKLTLQKFAPYYLQYYSNRAYIDGSTGALWKAAVESAQNDQVNLDRDVQGILHYELCLLVQQAGTFDNVDGNATKRFDAQLRRKYQAYWSVHPSDEEPMSYSKSPEIDMSQDVDFGRIADESEDVET